MGNVEYIEKNMFGLGQKLISRMEFGQVDKLFKVKPQETSSSEGVLML